MGPWAARTAKGVRYKGEAGPGSCVFFATCTSPRDGPRVCALAPHTHAHPRTWSTHTMALCWPESMKTSRTWGGQQCVFVCLYMYVCVCACL